MRHVRAFKRALNHLSHLHTFPTVWQMVQDVSFLKVCCRLPGTTCDSDSFSQTGFLPTYTPGRRWNNFNSLSLWDVKSSGNFQECITAEIIKKISGISPRICFILLQRKKQKTKTNPQPSNTKSTSLNFPVLFSTYLSHSAVVRKIVRTLYSRNHNHEDEPWITISRYSSFTDSSEV